MVEEKAGGTSKATDGLKAAGDAVKASSAKAAEVSMTMIDHAEVNTREAFAAMRAAAKAGSLTEVMKVQTDYIRDQGSRGLAQAREVGEMIAKLGREAIAPLTGKKDD